MLEVIENYEEWNEDNDYCSELDIVIKLNGEVVKTFNFCDGEPEDNNMSRNFNDVYKIIDALSLAYEAGKNGEEISFESNW